MTESDQLDGNQGTKSPPQEGDNQPAEAAVLEVLLATDSSVVVSTGSVPGYQQVLAGGTGTSTSTGSAVV